MNKSILALAILSLIIVSIPSVYATDHFDFTLDEYVYYKGVDSNTLTYNITFDEPFEKKTLIFYGIFTPENDPRLVEDGWVWVEVGDDKATGELIVESWEWREVGGPYDEYTAYVIEGNDFVRKSFTYINYAPELSYNQFNNLQNKISGWIDRIEQLDQRIITVEEKLDAATKDKAITRLTEKMENLLALQLVFEIMVETLNEQLSLYYQENN